MKRLNEILAKPPEDRTASDVAYLAKHFNELTEEQKNQIIAEADNGAISYSKTPIADKDLAWDASAEMAKTDKPEDWKAMCAWFDSSAPDNKGSYKLPHHQGDGKHAAVWNGVKAAMSALNGGRGGVDIPDGDKKAVYSHLAKHYKDFGEEAPEFAKSSADTTTNNIMVSLAKNKIQVVSKDDKTSMFSKPLPITDTSEQYNGTSYDVPTMDVDGWKQKVTTDHGDSIHNIVGQVINPQKSNKKVTIDGIKFYSDINPEAIFAKNMLDAGACTDFSIETIGPWPDEEGVYKNSALVGCSMVIVGNNKSATTFNEVYKNSVDEAKKKGLDTTKLEEEFSPIDNNKKVNNNDIDMKFKTVQNSRDFAITLKYKNSADKEVEVTLQPNQSIEVIDNDANKEVEKQVTEAKDPSKIDNNTDMATVVANAIATAVKPLTDKVADLEQKIFDNGATEPMFAKKVTKSFNTTKTTDELKNMDWEDRVGEQVNAAWDWLKGKNEAGRVKLTAINEFHLEQLKEKKLAKNSIGLADLGNFVINPELLSEIQGFRSNFQPLISKLSIKDTLSLEMAWLKRSGDIDMQEVDLDADNGNNNLKPISDYSAGFNTTKLQELAAVTPVVNAATRFLAADLLGDISQGFRTDYDRKVAQLFIARCQQAVDTTGNKVTDSGVSNLSSLEGWADLFGEVSEKVPDGVYIFNYKTKIALIKAAFGAGISGPLANMLISGDLSGILGNGYILVPNELLPTLNTGETKTFTIQGQSVTINQSVFYMDLTKYTGRTSGGLNYDMSTEAAYEDGDTVKSAFQRNELVLRGSFFRGGQVLDDDFVASMGAAEVS